MHFKKIIVLLLLTILNLQAYENSISQRFLEKIKHMDNLHMSFEQKFYPVGYDKPIVSYGEVYIQNSPPFKIKLIYTKPNKLTIVYDGKKTILYQNGQQYTYKGKNEEIKGISILNKNLEKIFRPILTSYQNGYYQILFMPRSKAFKDISYVILRLTKDLNPKSFYVYMPQKGVLYIKVISF
jgi:outer membrane lipoprotein-sorting protein